MSKYGWLLGLFISFTTQADSCHGHFVNPIKDVCWRCLFPLTIGNHTVVHSDLKDTPNAKNVIGSCPTSSGVRIGLNIGYWEPIALVDITDTPYCLVNLGGYQLPLGLKSMRGGRTTADLEHARAFLHVHWYKYPLMLWLNLITSAGCQQTGDFDVAYLTELDPTWRDSDMSFVLNPEAALFGNPVAASSCAADGISSTLNKMPIDKLFWCAGAQGTHYPINGHVNATFSPIQTALLLAERMNFKMHREHLIQDSSPDHPCTEHHYPIIPKSRYRYEMVNLVADGKHAYPSGHSTLTWEASKIKMHMPDQFGFLVWRKRNCVYL